VPNPKGKGKLDKLTNCGLYGPENSMKTLSDLYDVPVDYYAQINFEGVKTLVDAIGGITVYSTKTFKPGGMKDWQIYEGYNELDGTKALAFARERYRVPGGDNGRGKNQMRVITAIIDKVTSGTTIISRYSQIMDSMEGMFKTSVPMEDISALVKMQLDDMATWDIKSFAVTGEGGSEKTYSSPGHKSYVMHPHKYMVNHAQTLIEKVISGQILTDADMKVKK
jgi:LCP family protein required for cell wall assembly